MEHECSRTDSDRSAWPTLDPLRQSGRYARGARQASSTGRDPGGRRPMLVCAAFPFILLTSNGDREFPPAFLRRCIQLHLREPSEEQLTQIIRAHFGDDAIILDELVEAFLCRRRARRGCHRSAVECGVHGRPYHTGDSEGRKRVVDLLLQRLDPA